MLFLASSSGFDFPDMTMKILGGLGIFLFGITFMGEALKSIAGDRLRDFISKYTSNPIKGVLVGTITTVLIQSSSGTTALTIGLVRAGLMNLNQAIGIIMGANIGTTITAFLIGLKISKYALPIMTVGGILYMFANRKKFKFIGQAIFGFGSLFYGLSLMSSQLKQFKELEIFQQWMIELSDNPLMGVLVGTLMTFIIQSSSATIGILQSLYSQGALNIKAALPILFGDNIGTTITAVLASIGGSLTARRASAAHVIFNVIGSIIFLILLAPFTYWVIFASGLLNLNSETQIAFAHASFNISMTLLLLPFTLQLAKLVKFILPGKEETLSDYDEELLNPGLIEQSPTLAISQANNAIVHTGKLVMKSLNELEEYINTSEEKYLNTVLELETLIDSLDIKIRNYLVSISGNELTTSETRDLQIAMQTLKDFERMGDHVENLGELFKAMHDNNEKLSSDASKDFKRIYSQTQEIVKLAIGVLETEDQVTAGIIFEKENNIDNLEVKARQRHIYRISQKQCSGLVSAIYVDLLNNVERISDHAANIASYITNVEKDATIDYQYLGKLFDELDNDESLTTES